MLNILMKNFKILNSHVLILLIEQVYLLDILIFLKKNLFPLKHFV